MEIEFLRNALRFDNPRLANLASTQWQRVLAAADRERLTLALGERHGRNLPEPVALRIEQNLAATRLRFSRVRQLYEEIAAAFRSADLEFVVLKGFSHGLDRQLGDLDLYLPRRQILTGSQQLARLGYLPLAGTEDVPTDHLAPRMRRSTWTWRGDYFDPDAPLAVELHYQLWDRETERLPVAGLDEFWLRRRIQCHQTFCFPSLSTHDRIGYAALHWIRHLFRGDFRLFHVYELAQFLETHPAGGVYWEEWRQLHSASLRSIEALAFRFAVEWFGCAAPPAVSKEWEKFPESTRSWFEHCSLSPLQGKRRPDKSELWLHLSLLSSNRDRLTVAARRLFPIRRQKAQYAAHVPPECVTWRLRLRRKTFQMRFTTNRLIHHARATGPALAGGARLWARTRGLNTELFRFLLAASVFNIGMGMYYLLHNLFLLERGLREDSLGAVSSALGAGSLAGTLPAAFGLHRYGVRKLLLAAFAGVPLVSASRILWNSPEVLIGSAFAGGFLMSLYAVSLAPSVAHWTSEAARPFAFSLVFSLGIGMGIASSLIGGHLPQLLSLKNSLLLSCLIAASGSCIAWRLKPGLPVQRERRIYPRNRFVGRFLAAIVLWSLATGAFNPFFSAYFSRALHFRVRDIGFVAAAGQCVQVLAILCAPLLLKRLGAVAAVMSMQLATALALAMLSLGHTGLLPAAFYALYMGFQYMSEPGMYSLLMDDVAPHERGGAAALNFLAISGSQTLAAAVSGFCIKSIGYVPVLVFAAMLAALAALAFRSLGWVAVQPSLIVQTRSRISTTSRL